MGNVDNNNNNDNDAEENELVQLLAHQSYHLPGLNWCQDFVQFLANNHPIFGIFCHHKLHPINSCTRVIALIGTFAFGLAMTNIFFVFFMWNPHFDRVLATITTSDGEEWVLLTTGMLLLWTVGGGIHCVFNLTMWYIAACSCCQSGGIFQNYACCPNLGTTMIRCFVAFIFLLSILIVLLRVAINNKKEEYKEEEEYELDEYSNNNKGIDVLIDDQLNLSVDNISEFTFVLSYLIEMVLSIFVYYPIGVVILFSGCLSCGFKIPVLGGRPYEVAREEQRNTKKSGRKSTNANVLSDAVSSE